jgi:twinkle protein
MGQCVTKMPHSCGTRKGLQVFENEDKTLSGFCFSCHQYVHDPLGQGATIDNIPKEKLTKKSKEEIEEEIAEIEECEAIDLPDRKLRKEYLQYLGIKIGYDPRDGKTPAYHYYPYTRDGELVGYKVRHIKSKSMWSVGDQRDVDLFGWEQAIKTGAKRLIITEGELDAVAVRAILNIYTKENFKDYMPAVVSLAHGSGGANKDLAKAAPKIAKFFKEVVLCFDQDKSGEAATKEAMKVLPNALSATLPAKDANEALIKGKGKAAFNALTFNFAKVKNTSLIFGEDLHDLAREPAKFGELTWPWKGVQKVTRGIRYGETIYIGAGVKMGKSELLNALAAHFIKEHGVKVFMAKPEEANKKTYKLLAGKMEGKVFHDPEVQMDYDAYDRAGKLLEGKLAMVNLYQHMGWESLEADIISSVSWGAKVVFIDPITNLTNGLEASVANIKLQEYAQKLAAMALDNNIVIFIFCHLKAPMGSADHEHGGAVLSSQFAGSRAMMRSCNMMIGIEGDKSPTDKDGNERHASLKNQRDLVLLEDREFGQTGKFPLRWDASTTLFMEL